MNEQVDIPPAFVTEDLRKITEHPYLMTYCEYGASDEDFDEVYEEPLPDWQLLSDEELLDRFADPGDRYKNADFRDHGDHNYWPCSVIRKEDNGGDDDLDDDLDDDDDSNNSYTVQIHQNPHYVNAPWQENEVPRLLANVARQAIHFFVKPYQTDQQLPNTFRHFIGISDDIFPTKWKNSYESDSSQEEQNWRSNNEL